MGCRDYIIERTTGPWMLWRTVRYFQAYASAKDGTLTILEPTAIYPINWRAERNEACKTNNETGTTSLIQDEICKLSLSTCNQAIILDASAQLFLRLGRMREAVLELPEILTCAHSAACAECYLSFPDSYAITYWSHS